MIEGAGAIFGVQIGNEVHHTGVDGQSLPPTRAPVGRAEVDADAEGFGWVFAVLQQADDRLGDHQRDVAFQAVAQSAAQVFLGIGTRGEVYPYTAIAYFHRESADIIGKLVECATTGEVEAGVMPVTGEDAVADRAAIQWEAHVGAAIVHRVDAIPVGEQHESIALNVGGEGGFLPYFVQ